MGMNHPMVAICLDSFASSPSSPVSEGVPWGDDDIVKNGEIGRYNLGIRVIIGGRFDTVS
jgi:hypothetical protein